MNGLKWGQCVSSRTRPTTEAAWTWGSQREGTGASSAENVYKRFVITQDGSRETTMTGDTGRGSQHAHRQLTTLIRTNEAFFAPLRLFTCDLKLFCSHLRDNSSVNERLQSSSKLWRVGKCWKFPATCALGCWMQMYPKSLWQRNVLSRARGTVGNHLFAGRTQDEDEKPFLLSDKYCFSLT